MSKKYILGVAAAALLAVTGAAKAADVMPVVISVTPTVPPAVVGPTITAQITADAYLTKYVPGPLFLTTGVFGEVDIKTANGWGFNLTGGTGFLINPFSWDFSFRAELYRVIGNAQLGFYVLPYQFSPLVIEFGPTFRYKTARVEFWHETQIFYQAVGVWDVEFANDLTVHANDRLDIGGYFDIEFGGLAREIDFGVNGEMDVNDRLTVEGWAWAEIDTMGLDAGLGGQATFNLGALSPYVGIGLGTNAATDLFAGVDYERQLGTGPFKLIAGAGVDYFLGNGLEFQAYFGIRFNRGDQDDLLFDFDS